MRKTSAASSYSASSRQQKRTTDSAKNRILQAVLAEIPFDGWTAAAYRQGIKKSGIAQGEADLLMPGGIRDVIDAFGDWTDTAMMAKIESEPGFARLRVREKSRLACARGWKR